MRHPGCEDTTVEYDEPATYARKIDKIVRDPNNGTIDYLLSPDRDQMTGEDARQHTKMWKYDHQTVDVNTGGPAAQSTTVQRCKCGAPHHKDRWMRPVPDDREFEFLRNLLKTLNSRKDIEITGSLDEIKERYMELRDEQDFYDKRLQVITDEHCRQLEMPVVSR